MSNLDSIPGKLDALDERADHLEKRLSRLEEAMHEQTTAVDKRVAALTESIDKNTALTQDIKDIVTTGKVVSRFVTWLAGIITLLGGAFAAFKVMWP